jgi:signal transduction histidine kinase
MLRSNSRLLRYLAILAVLAALIFTLMLSVYNKARNDAINQIYAQERILAEEASMGIGDYFRYIESTLSFVAHDPDIIQANARGEVLLRSLFELQSSNLTGLTRVDENGRIIYSVPDASVAGRDISEQSHVKRILATHAPTLSSLFMAVQGYEAVALHYPVFDGRRFAGSLAVLIPFEEISRRYLEHLGVGRTGYAILLDQNGVELFGSNPDRHGKTLFETGRDFPSVMAMAEAIRAGGPSGAGAVAYNYYEAGKPGASVVAKKAFFRSFPVADGHWTVIITAPEAEAVAFIEGFRNRYFLFVGLVLAVLGVWGSLFLRTLIREKREASRLEAREAILEAERERSRALAILGAAIRQSPSAILIVNAPGGELIAANSAALDVCGLEAPISPGPGPSAAGPAVPKVSDSVCLDVAQLAEGAIRGESASGELLRVEGRAGETWYMVNTGPVRDEEGRIVAGIAILNDITALKRSESEIRGFNTVLERTVAERTTALEEANRALEATLGELRGAQSQLVLSEKLAVLGQLSASIAHQINTPLGAIRSASENIIATLQAGLTDGLARYAALSPELRSVYEALTAEGIRRKIEGPLESGASRDRRKSAAADLERLTGIEDASDTADDLYDMGLLDRVDGAARLAAAGGRVIIGDLFKLAGIAISSKIIGEAAGKATAVVKALGLYLSSGSREEAEALDLTEEIEGILSLFGERLRRIRLDKRLTPGLRVRVRAKSVSEVWSSLILNALQAMGYEGVLGIESRLEGERVVVEIIDSGPGIAPENAGRIFEPFFTTKPQGEGSGLGLAVARRIIEAEEGSIGFTSRPGRTSFIVVLPAWDENA